MFMLQVNVSGSSGLGLSPEINGVVIGLLLIVIAIAVLWKLRHFVVNSLLGLVALFLLQLVGVSVPVNLVTIIVAGVLGLIGVGLMVLLTVLGFKF